MDDHFLRLATVGLPGDSEVIGSPMDMFRLLDADPQRAGRLMDLGMLPWWTFTEVKAAFHFAVPLEHPSLRWLQWKDGVLAPFIPPANGQNVELKPREPVLRP
jgi:hypothetical protein